MLKMYNNQKMTSQRSVLLLLLSLFLNAFGNGLTVATNMGSSVWTASAANLAAFFNASIGTVLVIYGASQILINCLLTLEVNFKRILGNLIFIFCFGPFVAVSKDLFLKCHVDSAPVAVRIILVLIGVVSVGIAVSIYQRVNLFLHPGDEMTNIIRFKFVHGDAKKAQFLNFIIPIIVILFIGISTKRLVAVNIGTIFAFFFLGKILSVSDKLVFPKLTHRVNYQKKKEGGAAAFNDVEN
jgi:uncharacterized membrane protein YczE